MSGQVTGVAVVAEGAPDARTQLRRSLPVRRHAVKLAWSDMRRNVTRTVVTLLLMGVPVALVMGYATVMHSEVAHGDAPHGRSELVIDPSDLGDDSDFRVPTDPAAGHTSEPWGDDAADSAAAVLASLEAASGVPWVATASQVARVEAAGVTSNKMILLVNGARGTAAAASVVSGRWPENPGEVMVSEAGIQSGLPESGTMTVTVAGETRSATVVGVGRGYAHASWSGSEPAELVGWLDETTAEPGSALYLLAEGHTCDKQVIEAVAPVVWGHG